MDRIEKCFEAMSLRGCPQLCTLVHVLDEPIAKVLANRLCKALATWNFCTPNSHLPNSNDLFIIFVLANELEMLPFRTAAVEKMMMTVEKNLHVETAVIWLPKKFFFASRPNSQIFRVPPL
jgi:hypothetical protein